MSVARRHLKLVCLIILVVKKRKRVKAVQTIKKVEAKKGRCEDFRKKLRYL